MTAAVLVEHPIPTSERREIRQGYTNARWKPLAESFYADMPEEGLQRRVGLGQIALRTVTVAGTVWVTLEGVPCPECGGTGEVDDEHSNSCDRIISGASNPQWMKDCDRCDGSGVRPPDLGDGVVLLGEERCHWDGCTHGAGCCHARQVIQWKAHDKLLLPVVKMVGPWTTTFPCIEVLSDGDDDDQLATVCTIEGGQLMQRFDDTLPASLRPGQFVARFDGLEAVDPITEMQCPRQFDAFCGLCSCSAELTVPLELRSGIVNTVDLP